MKKKMINKYLDIFLCMLKIGTFTFGGGYAMIPLMENEFISRRGWINKDEFLDMVAIAESTPGPIAINASTYIGYKVGGFWGSLVGTVGISLPSLWIIYLISLFFDEFLSVTYVGYAFKGIQIAVIYLMLTAGIKMLKGLKKTPFNMIIVSLVTVIMILSSIFALNFSSIVCILVCGGVGIAIYLISLIKKSEVHRK